MHFTPPCGPVTGWRDRSVRRATGIPYARADRFRAPVPVGDWTEPFEATSWSAPCPQVESPELVRFLGDVDYGLAADENCQRLSVTMPETIGDDELLPVMVWIHGGSYVTGAGDSPIMDPFQLVVEQRIVVVTVTYRLGILGYVGDGDGRPANLGLLDQIEAFRWVQRNIAAFGGDPARVTAAGQSAGADAVVHLMATPHPERLFARAVVQSAPLGISRGRAAMNRAMSEAMADLTADTPVEEVVAAQADVVAAGGGHGLRSAMPFGTQYGFSPLPDEGAVDGVWGGVAPRIPILIGHTAEEARMFLPGMPGVGRAIGLPVVGRVLGTGLTAALTTAVYGTSARRLAAAWWKAGGEATSYVIDWSVPGNPWGSAHTIDLPLLFGDMDTWRRAELLAGVDPGSLRASGRRIRQIWGDFIRGGSVRGIRIRGLIRTTRPRGAVHRSS